MLHEVSGEIFFSELRSSRKYPYPPFLKWWRHKPIRQYITAKCIMGRLHNPPLTGMLTLSFQILTYLCFNENEADVEIVTLPRKRILVSVWKFYRRSQLKTRVNWQKFERFSPKKLTSESFDNDNKLTLKSFFAFCSFLFFQGPTEEKRKRHERTQRLFTGSTIPRRHVFSAGS